jgi:hypothetical protein
MKTALEAIPISWVVYRKPDDGEPSTTVGPHGEFATEDDPEILVRTLLYAHGNVDGEPDPALWVAIYDMSVPRGWMLAWAEWIDGEAVTRKVTQKPGDEEN